MQEHYFILLLLIGAQLGRNNQIIQIIVEEKKNLKINQWEMKDKKKNKFILEMEEKETGIKKNRAKP